ncbi:MAG: NAD(P)-binding domain-containing protein, partial [Actinobacteria bacterium]|nr:NAD(P)-binding domain-containing protein [Actinomycetota bacterium]
MGDEITKKMTVGVVGCGTMGAGISEISAKAGYRVIFSEVDDAQVEQGLERIEHSLGRAEAKGKITSEQRHDILKRISATTELKGLAEADVVIEAIPEFLDLKRDVFAKLDEVLKEDAIIATNTSSLSVIELAVATKRPERVLGIHFFNPAPVMQLVELVTTVTSAPDVVDTARAFVEGMGKKVVLCRDRAGFIANLLLFPYLNEAVKLLEGGFASREDIDAAMRFGAGHPMGPLSLLDLVGLDSCSEILESLYKQFSEPRYAPSPAFRHLVAANYMGRKSTKGFYTYGEADSPATVEDDRSGRVINLPEPSLDVQRVGIIGTGTMGAGLVEVAARSGAQVVCRGRSDASVAKTKAAIEKSTAKAVDKGKLDENAREQILGRVTWTTDLASVGDCDVIIESLAEDLELKKTLFAELDLVAKHGAILGTGTSSLPVIEIASATTRPESVVGIHFFNPANLMKLVEIVRTV